MAKKKTQWRPHQRLDLVEVQGKTVVIPGFEKIPCFIRRGMKDVLGQEIGRGYTIHEISTGRRIARGGTQKQTVLNAASVMRENEEKLGKDSVRLEIEQVRKDDQGLDGD